MEARLIAQFLKERRCQPITSLPTQPGLLDQSYGAICTMFPTIRIKRFLDGAFLPETIRLLEWKLLFAEPSGYFMFLARLALRSRSTWVRILSWTKLLQVDETKGSILWVCWHCACFFRESVLPHSNNFSQKT